MTKVEREVNNKLKGAYGATTFIDNKAVKIEINKKKHKRIKSDKTIPKKSRTLLDTIVHEEMHAKHPKMHEKTVRKLTPRKIMKMTKKQKSKLYSKYG